MVECRPDTRWRAERIVHCRSRRDGLFYFMRGTEMTAVKQEDLVQNIADAFQYISYYHPRDFIQALG